VTANAREFEQEALVHLDSLYRAALRLTHNRADAEDLVQETYVKALRAFHRYNPGTNCRAWLFTIMRNAFLNRIRNDKREILDDEPGLTGLARAVTDPAGIDSPEEEFFQTILHGDVDRALKGLPLVYREAVVLADLEGLTYKEIAEVLGCPPGTVMSRLSRGRQLLRHALRRFAREHGYTRGDE
jgi:RNA polymerase sigma-70 factor (ECF subfamily)